MESPRLMLIVERLTRRPLGLHSISDTLPPVCCRTSAYVQMRDSEIQGGGGSKARVYSEAAPLLKSAQKKLALRFVDIRSRMRTGALCKSVEAAR